MSNYPQIPGIGEGEFHDMPEISKRTLKAAVAISEGETVAISTTADDGITVVLADTDVAGGEFVCGVAMADVAEDAYGEFQTKGLFTGLIGVNLAVGQGVFPTAIAGSSGIVAIAGQETTHPFGVVLGGTATAGTVFLDCFGG